MDILKIYQRYNIPPNLQQHMIRVAAFATLIVNSWKGQNVLDKGLIVTSCLLHDLGNIIKFDFENFPELLGPEIKNIEFWKKVKKDMIKKYGKDEDIATVRMVKGLRVSKKILFIVENWGFKNFTKIAKSDNWSWKIAVYSDHRISPQGVVTLKENLENKQKRYKLSRPTASHISDKAKDLYKSAMEIESEIAKNVSLDLQKINTDELDKFLK